MAINSAQYDACKILLGLAPRSCRFGDGGMVRALAETRILTRAGTRVLQRTVLARARLLSLPDDTPVARVLHVASSSAGLTWLDHVKDMASSHLILPDFLDAERLTVPDRRDPARRRAAVLRWKRKYVVPRIREVELTWFREQIVALNDDGLIPYKKLLPIHGPFRPGLVWAPWGKTMWRFYRAWAIARITGRLPVEAWGMGEALAASTLCPLCEEITGASLLHLVASCQGTACLRGSARAKLSGDGLSDVDFLRCVLCDTPDLAALREKVCFLGLATCSLVHALK